jgi:probable rRNA maturation factor
VRSKAKAHDSKADPIALPTARTLARYLKAAQEAVRLRGQVTVLLTSDAAIRKLNRQFRGRDKATDVLSFPVEGLGTEEMAGDLAISVTTALRQANEQGHALWMEIKVLMLHGLLHLAGYDHESDGGKMARRERVLRARLKLPQGLIERVSESAGQRVGESAGMSAGGSSHPRRKSAARAGRPGLQQSPPGARVPIPTGSRNVRAEARTLQPTTALRPTKNRQPAKALQTTKALQPTKTLQPTKNRQPAKALQPTKTLQPTKNRQPAEALRTTKALQPTKNRQPTKAPRPAMALSPAKSLRAAKSRRLAQAQQT